MHRSQSRPLGFAACALASCFWGCGFFFGKIALREMNVGAMVLYRFLFALAAMVPFLLTRRPGFSRRDWLLLLTASFLGIPLQFLIQFHGLSLTTVSHASLMVGTLPVLLAAGAAIFTGERLDALGWGSLAASTLGACLIALGGRHHAEAGGPSLQGDLLIVLSLTISLSWILLNKELLRRHSSVAVSTWGLLLGTLMLMVIAPAIWGLPPVHAVSGRAWLALAGSGVLCTASTTLLWNWGLTQVPASQAGVLLNMEPLIGSLLGVLVLGESLGASAWAGGSLILLAAVTLTTHSSTAVAPNELL